MADNEEASTGSLADRAKILLEARRQKEVAEELLRTANLSIERAEQSLYEQMQQENIEKFAAHGMLFYPIVQAFPSVNKELENEFFEWLEAKNESGIIKRTIHNQTLRAWWSANSDQFAEEISANQFLKIYEKIRIASRKQI